MRRSNLAADIALWLWQQMNDAGADGYVVGLSGGIDSTVAAKLAVMGVGIDNVLGVSMRGKRFVDDDSPEVAAWLRIEYFDAPLEDVFNHMLLAFGADRHRVPRGNLMARLRMCGLYYLANSMNRLVLGTGNKAELELGYFTKYGDGGVDVLPLGSLLKHEVKSLACKLKVPREIIEKPPSAGLWEGQTDEEEIGVTYKSIDCTLSGHQGWFPPEDEIRIKQMHLASRHKREMPPIYRRK